MGSLRSLLASGFSPNIVLALPLIAACGLTEIPRPKADRGGSGDFVYDAGSPPASTPDAGGPSPTVDAKPAPPRPMDAAPRPDTGSTPPTPPPPMGTPMPPAGGGVVINGVAFPKEKVIVFLHLGHSNMAGRTTRPAELQPLNFETHPRLWAYAKGGAWRPAKEPLSGDAYTAGGAGPGMSILRTALERVPAANDVMIVSIGRGQDGSRGGWCRNFRKGALMYDYVMAPAMELKGKVTFGGIFTMLGVNEFRRDFGNIPRFNECMAGIASDMRTDLGDPEIPFMMGDWELGATGDFAPTHDYAIATRMQLRIAEMKIPRAAIIPSENLPMSDDHHYDLRGYKMWAERAFGIMTMKGWAPWASE